MANLTGVGGFKKGQSGNPAGRSKSDKTIQDLARSHCPMALDALVKIAKAGKTESARAQAANSILDRGYGRPPQFNTGDAAQFRRAMEMSDDELASIAAGRSEGVDPAPLDPSQLN